VEERDRCERSAENLSAFLDGELDAQTANEIAAHVASCTRCGARLEALRRVDADLAALPSPAIAGDLQQRLHARIAADASAQRRGPPRRRRLPLLPVSAAAAAAATAVLYLAVGGEVPPELPGEPGDSRIAEIDLETASEEEISLAFDLDTIEDLEVIANLDLLEALVALEEGTS